MKTFKRILGLSALTIGLLLSTQTVVSADAKFKDVSTSHWANNAIQSAVSKGFFKGYSDGSFKPNAPVTREEFAVLMARVSNNEQVNESVELKDIKGRWSESGVSEAIAKGFVDGSTYVKNGFKPQQAITRVEMDRWMVSGLQVKDEDYKQAVLDTMDTIVPVAEYYKGGLSDKDYGVVSVALGTGLMNGYSDGKFNASKTTTRAEVAAILLRYEQIQDKKAKDYQQLNELREVGLTGTNAESMNIYPLYNSGNPQSFEIVRGKTFKLSGNKGTAKMQRMIFVDFAKTDSLYYTMFVGKNFNLDINKDNLAVFTLVEATPSVVIKSYSDWLKAFHSDHLSGSVFMSDSIKSYEVPTLPMRTIGDILKKGQATEYWGYSAIKKDKGVVSIYTVNFSVGLVSRN